MEQQFLDKLQNLNSKSVTHFYDIDELDWTRPINRNIKWVPEEMNYISYLPSYKLLTDAQKLRYNQLYAMSVCEQFVWLENNLLAGILTDGMQKKELPDELKKGMSIFFTEEEKHSEMFWRTLEKCEPTWYKNDRTFKIFKTSKMQDHFFNTITKYNHNFLVWIWLALFFEERTLDFSKKYQKAYVADKEHIEFNLWQVHYYHMKDEMRHHQMDEIFLSEFYDNSPKWKRKICGWMFFKLMKAYLAPKRNAKVMLSLLEDEFPELKQSDITQRIRAELPLLERDKVFQEKVFGRGAIGRTIELMAKYDEFNPVWDLLLNEKRENFIG